MLPLVLARQIFSGKRGLRTKAAYQPAEMEDDDSSIADILEEDVLEDATPSKKTRKPRTPQSLQFSHPDGSPVEVLEYNGKPFVRFVDVLPQCPSKGEFDVNKIRLSPYFFS